MEGANSISSWCELSSTVTCGVDEGWRRVCGSGVCSPCTHGNTEMLSRTERRCQTPACLLRHAHAELFLQGSCILPAQGYMCVATIIWVPKWIPGSPLAALCPAPPG